MFLENQNEFFLMIWGHKPAESSCCIEWMLLLGSGTRMFMKSLSVCIKEFLMHVKCSTIYISNQSASRTRAGTNQEPGLMRRGFTLAQ